MAISSCAMILGEGSANHSMPVLLFVCVCYFSCAAVSLLGWDRSTVAQQAETTVSEHSLISCL